ncbi:MAG: STAS domain-containing protein [Deltaproteobacteria bacterium]|nr:STAS domain-containing protein [Deltaproteobacteria bacterium]
MEIAVTQESTVTVFSITGRLDALSAPDVEAKLNQWLEQNETRLVIDLEGLNYISSAGLRILLSVAKKMKARGGVLFLARLQAGVKQVFDISGFTAIIPIYETVGAALEAAK